VFSVEVYTLIGYEGMKHHLPCTVILKVFLLIPDRSRSSIYSCFSTGSAYVLLAMTDLHLIIEAEVFGLELNSFS
jgi:hypothetical protein